MTTEAELRDWRQGQIAAERMCAAILAIDNYVDIDPQAPLGGPDGRKDILAVKSGKRVVVGVYFPPTHPAFGQIKTKYTDDRVGVQKYAADHFVFMVNQPLTVAERAVLLAAGSQADQIYHLERLRAHLDSPAGYGVRLEFLRRGMTIEEQVAFFSTLRVGDLSDTPMMQRLDEIAERTRYMMSAIEMATQPSSIISPLARTERISVAQLDVSMLKLLHRAVTAESDMPRATRGELRTVRVWIGDASDPTFIPPPPDEVPILLNQHLAWWRHACLEMRTDATSDESVEVLSRLHYGIVQIHPFLDGNGRVARHVTDEAARELLGVGVDVALVRNQKAYFAALKSASTGDFSEIIQLMRAALE
ncbi:Fic family protein [Couchioplanes azureus]|uniref:Fic family protein n=1 Tax=Couchioplanes caeruleus TaxID=56438 RepID=UPI00166FD7D3|nr:Fic family protein [Couchioplanes caeruleus]GGQ83610.1 hypothetical protein GCM10010166_62210 [Couchioplanes caeruleus subsp. azureus]